MRYPTVLQYSEEDCGAACLAIIARYHGRLIAMGHAREVVGTGQLGTTLPAIIHLGVTQFYPNQTGGAGPKGGGRS